MPLPFETFINAFSRLPEEKRLLDEDFILCPPKEDFGYQSTPKNALIFSEMRVDGVHTAILKIQGAIRNDSPVVCVSPMDSNDVFVLAESFLGFLADGCQASPHEIESLCEQEQAGESVLVPFLWNHFNIERIFEDSRIDELTTKFKRLIERNVDWVAPPMSESLKRVFESFDWHRPSSTEGPFP